MILETPLTRFGTAVILNRRLLRIPWVSWKKRIMLVEPERIAAVYIIVDVSDQAPHERLLIFVSLIIVGKRSRDRYR